MSRLTPLLCSLLLIGLAAPLAVAQNYSVPPTAPAPVTNFFEATITRKGGSMQRERIISTDALGINVMTANGVGAIKLPHDQLESVQFAPPANWETISKAIKENRAAEAEAPMREIALRMAPMTAIPAGDAMKYVFAYVDVLRSLGKNAEALAFLNQPLIPPNAPAVAKGRLIIIKASCLAALGKIDEAERMLNSVQAPTEKSSLFTTYLIARASIDMAKKNYLSALDNISQALTFRRLGSESYDEALYLGAEIYEALQDALEQQKKVVAEDKRLSRQMEQDNLDAITRFKLIKSDPLQVAAIWTSDRDFRTTATTIRTQLVRVYPDSPWFVKARAKLPPDVIKMLEEESNRDAVKTAQESQSGEPKATPTPTPTPTPSPSPDADGGRKDRRSSTPTPTPAAGATPLQLDETTNNRDEGL